jgi:hypothetical protein
VRYTEVELDLSKSRDQEILAPLGSALYVVYCDGDAFIQLGDRRAKPLSLRKIRYLKLEDDELIYISNNTKLGGKCVLRFTNVPILSREKSYVLSSVSFSLSANESLGIALSNNELYSKLKIEANGPVSVSFSKLSDVVPPQSTQQLYGFNTYTRTYEAIGAYGSGYSVAVSSPFPLEIKDTFLPAGLIKITNLSGTNAVNVNVDIIIDRGGVSVE